MFVFFGLYVLLSILCVLFVCIVLSIVPAHVYICLFPICVKYYTTATGWKTNCGNERIIYYKQESVKFSSVTPDEFCGNELCTLRKCSFIAVLLSRITQGDL